MGQTLKRGGESVQIPIIILYLTCHEVHSMELTRVWLPFITLHGMHGYHPACQCTTTHTSYYIHILLVSSPTADCATWKPWFDQTVLPMQESGQITSTWSAALLLIVCVVVHWHVGWWPHILVYWKAATRITMSCLLNALHGVLGTRWWWESDQTLLPAWESGPQDYWLHTILWKLCVIALRKGGGLSLTLLHVWC